MIVRVIKFTVGEVDPRARVVPQTLKFSNKQIGIIFKMKTNLITIELN